MSEDCLNWGSDSIKFSGRQQIIDGEILHQRVVIIDSNSPDLEATALEAQKAREMSDIELFVVAVGKEVSDAEMKAIASLPHDHHILTASNYDDLPRLVSTLKERIDDLCNGKHTLFFYKKSRTITLLH